jgi:Skp family chaperone for outer membrane proteins
LQFQELHGADIGASGAADREIATLRQRHDVLAGQIADQIKNDAERLAKARGFTLVISDVQAAPGGYDMTNDLIADIESTHQ